MSIKESLERLALNQVLNYVEKDPDKNIVKIIDWLEKFDKKQTASRTLPKVKAAMSDPNNNWSQLVHSLYQDIDVEVRKKMFVNFVLNSYIIGCEKQRENEERYDCNIPWAILMDPTSACNLKCTGCWAAEYGHKLNMSLETLNSIIEQGKKLGTYMYIFSGGEPLVRKDDIIKLCRKHDDCMFLAFTNSTLIDEKFANEMLEVKNFIPAISIEGFKEATDFRRGEGTYDKCIAAMNLLKEKKLPFGISCCYTSKNIDVIGSEEYFDSMIEMGAKFAWFFTYIPVGTDAACELMCNAEQRKHMFHQLRKFRETKPLFTIDFWNDGEYVKGCIAGARNYLHINANGDIEPCAFIHYSDSNIHQKTLLEAYQSPLFMEYRRHQPFNCNHLRPCPLLDNPNQLREVVNLSGAKSTDCTSPENVDHLCKKCDKTAMNWGPVATQLWNSYHQDKMSNN